MLLGGLVAGGSERAGVAGESLLLLVSSERGLASVSTALLLAAVRLVVVGSLVGVRVGAVVGALGRALGDDLQGLEDGLWDRGRSGQMGALRLVSVLIGGVGERVVLAVVSGVGELSLDGDALALQLTLTVLLDAVAGLVAGGD